MQNGGYVANFFIKLLLFFYIFCDIIYVDYKVGNLLCNKFSQERVLNMKYTIIVTENKTNKSGRVTIL